MKNAATASQGTAVSEPWREALRLFDAAQVAALNARGDRLRTELAQRGVPVAGSGSLLRLLLDDPDRFPP